jgi:uncharacterized protein (DUF2141 family)
MSLLKIALITTLIASTAALPVMAGAQPNAAPAPASAAPATGSASLTITFTGITEKTGAIMGVIVNSEAGYTEKAAPVRMIMIPVTGSEVSQVIDGLAPGNYAIKLFHDVDGDKKMSTNPYGMPIEPFAFSNNAKGNMGPASWADAKFVVAAGANSHSITID